VALGLWHALLLAIPPPHSTISSTQSNTDAQTPFDPVDNTAKVDLATQIHQALTDNIGSTKDSIVIQTQPSEPLQVHAPEYNEHPTAGAMQMARDMAEYHMKHLDQRKQSQSQSKQSPAQLLYSLPSRVVLLTQIAKLFITLPIGAFWSALNNDDRLYGIQYKLQGVFAEIAQITNKDLFDRTDSLDDETAWQMYVGRMMMVRDMIEWAVKMRWAHLRGAAFIDRKKIWISREPFQRKFQDLALHGIAFAKFERSYESSVECEMVVATHPSNTFGVGKVILYLPGGGFVIGSHRTHRDTTMYLAQHTGATVLAVNYRKVPEFAFPHQLEDALMAYLYALGDKHRGSDMVIMGDSAGGNIAANVIHLINQLATKVDWISRAAGTVLFSPWLDCACDGLSWTSGKDWMPPQTKIPPSHRFHPSSQYAANGIKRAALDLRSPLYSPLYADWSQFGPLLLVTGEHDSTQSDAESLASKLTTSTTSWNIEIYRHAGHVFMLGRGRASSRAWKSILTNLESMWTGTEGETQLASNGLRLNL